MYAKSVFSVSTIFLLFTFKLHFVIRLMEAVGLKLARLPKQLIRNPVLTSALGKGIKPSLNGIKQYSVVAGQTFNQKSNRTPSPPISSFSSIW